jgi:hypothetical protein
VTWSLTVGYMLAVYLSARHRHHLRANTPWQRALVLEAKTLVPLVLLCEATNFSFQVSAALGLDCRHEA